MTFTECQQNNRSLKYLRPTASLYVADVPNLAAKLKDIDALVQNVSNVITEGNKDEIGIVSFIPDFEDFLTSKHNVSLLEQGYTALSNDSIFRTYLTEFLYTTGRSWQKNFDFYLNDSLTCGQMTPPIQLISFEYIHTR